MGFLVDEVSLSRESNYYLIWKMRMQAYLEGEGIYVWKSFFTGYTPQKKSENNSSKGSKEK